MVRPTVLRLQLLSYSQDDNVNACAMFVSMPAFVFFCLEDRNEMESQPGEVCEEKAAVTESETVLRFHPD